MTANKNFKRLVRTRAEGRGQSYAASRRQLLAPPPVAGGAGQKPAHWLVRGTKPDQYTVEVDPSDTYEGKPVARLTFTGASKPEGFGSILQTFGGRDFIGQRIRFTGMLRAHDVDDWAGLWIRVDGAGSASLSFDNMEDRPVKGTTDWVPCELVVDVPEETAAVVFGALLSGRGSVSIADLAMEAVDRSVAPTGPHVYETAPGPMNLDFAELVPSK